MSILCGVLGPPGLVETPYQSQPVQAIENLLEQRAKISQKLFFILGLKHRIRRMHMDLSIYLSSEKECVCFPAVKVFGP